MLRMPVWGRPLPLSPLSSLESSCVCYKKRELHLAEFALLGSIKLYLSALHDWGFTCTHVHTNRLSLLWVVLKYYTWFKRVVFVVVVVVFYLHTICIQPVAMAPVKWGLPVVTVCFKDNLSSAFFEPEHLQQNQNGEVFSVTLYLSLDYFDKCLFSNIIDMLQQVRSDGEQLFSFSCALALFLLPSAVKWKRLDIFSHRTRITPFTVVRQDKFLVMSAVINGLWNMLGPSFVCTRVFPCENGRKTVRKHTCFCFSFWDQLLDKQALMVMDRPLSVTLISGSCFTHVWFWWNLME